MIDHATWQQGNDEYLGLALSWLRARLDAISPSAPPLLPSSSVAIAAPPDRDNAPPAEHAEPSFWSRFTSRDRRTSGASSAAIAMPGIASPARIALPPGGTYNPVAVAADLERQLREREAADPPPALIILAKRLGLTEFERQVMLLVCATELDTRVAAHCARAQDEAARPYPTFALAMALFDTPSWDVLSPERPLRFWRLVEITQPSGASLMASVLRADERIVNYVKGLNYLDDRLAPIATPLEIPALHVALPSSHEKAVRRVLDSLPVQAADVRLPMVQLTGADGPTKQLVAAHAASKAKRDLYHVVAESLPTSSAELELLARLWDREAALMPLALYLDEPLVDGPPAEASAASLDRFASRVRSLAFVSSREPRPLRGTLPVIVDVSRATATEQRDVWRALLPDADASVAERLSAQFDLSLPVIERVVADARAASEGAAPSLDALWSACLGASRPRLEQLARRIDPKATWDDLVLPNDQLATLRQLVAQVSQRSRVYEDWGWGQRMSRGLGITALFAGESGTGKTMAAEVIARDLRLDLYRIDLSGVVSKYIGETEKNLRRVFDAAEAGGAILLFDEADALFGKRSEVKDSHDRYANVEINYLLQRLEAYRGLAILTTNMKSAMDQAFTRRLRFVVDFPFPGIEERRRMWSLVFPAATECVGLDLDRLARFALTGGSIHNVALNSAFLSAHAGEPVMMPRVLDAMRAEYRKLARPVSESDFRALVAEGGGSARA